MFPIKEAVAWVAARHKLHTGGYCRLVHYSGKSAQWDAPRTQGRLSGFFKIQGGILPTPFLLKLKFPLGLVLSNCSFPRSFPETVIAEEGSPGCMGLQGNKVRVCQEIFFIRAHKVSKGFTVKSYVPLSHEEVSWRDSRVAMKARNWEENQGMVWKLKTGVHHFQIMGLKDKLLYLSEPKCPPH